MTLSKEHLVWALRSIMENIEEDAISEITGLPSEAYEAIWSVYTQALQAPAQRPQ